MRELVDLKRIANALDVGVHLEKALQFLKDKGIDKPFFDGFPGYHLDFKKEVERFKIDYLPSSLVIVVLSLEKDYKTFETNEAGEKVEIANPIQQEKVYIDGKMQRFTNFFSIQYLQEVSKEFDLKLETFQFGRSIVHLSILYFDRRPAEILPEIKTPEKIVNIENPVTINSDNEIEEIIKEFSPEKPKEKIKTKKGENN